MRIPSGKLVYMYVRMFVCLRAEVPGLHKRTDPSTIPRYGFKKVAT